MNNAPSEPLDNRPTIPCPPPDFEEESPESDRKPMELVALKHILHDD